MIADVQKQTAPIKICALTTISLTMEWFVVDSMRNLQKNGYEVTLICNMDDNFIKDNSDFARCISLNMSRGIDYRGVIRTPFQLWKIFRREKFDILYYTSPNAALYASFAGKLAGIKTRVYSQCGLRYVSFHGLKRMLFHFIEMLTCSFSTHIRAQSPQNLRFAVEEKLCSRKKIAVVGIGGTTGVDLDSCRAFDHGLARRELRSRYGIPQEAFVYGYVGRINADKGICELLGAFAQLQEEQQNAYLCLVGMTDSENPVEAEAIERAKSNPRIVFTGGIPSSQVYPHMTVFDVLVHPTYREGFGKVLQEAMGVELPIITTNVPGPSEVVEDEVSGLLVEVKNANALTCAMRRLYSDTRLRERLAKGGRERAEIYFDRPVMLMNILDDLNEIMERK